jgi:transcriptional regulator NrdR family protein
MAEVIKKSGNKETFNPGKVKTSIEKAVIDAGFNIKTEKVLIDRVASKVVIMSSNNGRVRTADIRKKILMEMDEINPSISSSWRRFDKRYKVT